MQIEGYDWSLPAHTKIKLAENVLYRPLIPVLIEIQRIDETMQTGQPIRFNFRRGGSSET
jgi:hypothetical protein